MHLPSRKRFYKLVVAVSVALSSTRTHAAPPTSQSVLPMLLVTVDGELAQMESLISGLSDRHLTADERDVVLKFSDSTKKLRDRCEALYRVGGDPVACQKLHEDFLAKSAPFKEYLASHPNVLGKAMLGMGLGLGRPAFMADENAPVAALNSMEIVPDKLAAIKSRIEKFRQHKANLVAHPPEQSWRAFRLDARGEGLFEIQRGGNDAFNDILASLSADQARTWDNALVNFVVDEGHESAALVTQIAWSNDLDQVNAPRDGTYQLNSWQDKHTSKLISSIQLKNGDSVGFRIEKGITIAFAKDQSIPLPQPNGTYFWLLVPPEVKPAVQKK